MAMGLAGVGVVAGSRDSALQMAPARPGPHIAAPAGAAWEAACLRWPGPARREPREAAPVPGAPGDSSTPQAACEAPVARGAGTRAARRPRARELTGPSRLGQQTQVEVCPFHALAATRAMKHTLARTARYPSTAGPQAPAEVRTEREWPQAPPAGAGCAPEWAVAGAAPRDQIAAGRALAAARTACGHSMPAALMLECTRTVHSGRTMAGSRAAAVRAVQRPHARGEAARGMPLSATAARAPMRGWERAERTAEARAA